MFKSLLVLALMGLAVFLALAEGSSYSHSSGDTTTTSYESSCETDENIKCTRPHEHYECGSACQTTCSNLGKPCPIINIKCNEACYCDKGFARSGGDKAECIPISKCKAPTCGKNEVFSNCTNGGCGPKYCDDQGYNIGCVKMDQKYCKPGCVCKENYLRDEDGKCIPKTECPECGGDSNAVAGCGVNCGRHCSDIGKKPQVCATVCYVDACDCRKGFYYDDNIGKCVRPEACSSTCGKHEVFSNCTNGGCGPKSCDDLGYNVGCVKIDQKYCKIGCLCKEGYLRDDNGDCIPKTECPKCRGDSNAVAGCGVNCGRHCADIGKEPQVCPAICYDNACDCRKGFYYDGNIGKCVRPTDCTSVCGENEVFSTCVNGGCDAENCLQLGKPVPCVRPAKCRSGCLCKEGWLRNNRGECVPIKQCPASTCGKNEVFSNCTNGGCGPKSCDNLGNKIGCVKMDQKYCKAGCQCKEGYLRDENGDCIPKGECPKCGGDSNAITGCGVNCGRHCADIGKEPQVCPAICYDNACDCRKGFYFDDIIGKCVRAKDCTSTCGKNEVFSNCTNGRCGPKSCDDLGYKIRCEKIDQKSCKAGCLCKEGYLRDEDGECVPKRECPKCGGDSNAVAGCGVNCGRHCSNIGKEPQVCPAICYDNACDCRKGFYYDGNIGKCVRPTDCTSVCGENEVFSTCVNGGCAAKNCSQLGKPVPCVRPVKCRSGCLCIEGWLRNNKGECVPIKQCPAPQCADDEIYKECPDSLCTPKRCTDLGFPLNCSSVSGSSCRGKPACICDNGNVKDKDGNCIAKEQCPSCGGDPNAVTGCSNYCGNRCADYKNNNTVCPLFCIINGCACRKGFVYDDQVKKCVKPKDCSAKCGPNERYENCPKSLCSPQKCSQLGFPMNCTISTDDSDCRGPPSCVCDYGYVRDDDGNCIRQEDCPSCGGDPNAVKGCGVNCGSLCSNYYKELVPCPKICKPNSCDCRKGYVLDQNIKKCVRPKECTPICDNNEVYSECINGGCKRKNCTQLGKPVPCIKINPKDCIKGCLCKDGYLRENGKCIPQDQCKSSCKKPHEIYDPCPPICPPQTCNSIGKKFHCPIIPASQARHCTGACRCEKGYYRNKNGDCISEAECKLECPDGEIYEKCPQNLCTPKTCSQLGYPLNCSSISESGCPGKPGCICDSGNVRNKEGICVPKEECPSCGGDPNAVSGCGNYCGKRCSDYKNEKTFCPLFCILNGCMCKNGYVYDDNLKKCVRPKDCTPTCGINEVFDSCANGGCRKYNCSQYILCIDPIECKAGCSCKDGYSRLANGTCIPEDQCPVSCKKPNEIFDPCPPNCPPQTCDSIGKKYPCPTIPANKTSRCKGACRCKKGYYRSRNGDCVSEEECETSCGPNERYEEKPSSICEPLDCSELGFPLNCTDDIDPNEEPGCICEDGYVRDGSGGCVQKSKCTSCGGDPNAVSGCSNYCGNRCADYKNKNTICTLICKQNGCACKNGFVYDDNIKKCVRPKDCTATCGTNEVFDSCANGGCRRFNCSQPKICIDPIKCKAGCSCKNGYSRLANGTCIPENQCPVSCKKPNEFYDPCPPICPPQTCDSIGKKYSCPLKPADKTSHCKGACRCKKGYYRNRNGDCVSEEECETSCGPNERYEEKPSSICEPLDCSELGFPLNCTEDTDPNEQPGCVCDDGYVRNDDGDCVQKSKCPSCGGDPNAVSGCSNYCGNRCADYKNEKTVCTRFCMQNGCACKNGFVYDDNIKKCVRPKECTATCGTNEVFDSCANGGCRRFNCSQPTLCIDPIKCKAGCSCKDGYSRLANGTCIPENQCPVSCKKPNEFYDPCPPICPPQTCDSIGKKYSCPTIPANKTSHCKGACRCKKGYYRSRNGDCVSEEECETSCGPNERYEEKPSSICEPLDCSELGFPLNCTDDTDPKEEPGCVCDDGYVRNNDGDCVQKSKCPSCGGDPNAVSGCSNYCGNRCADYKNENTVCTRFCMQNGCACKNGFVYDDNIKKCVRPKDCTATCGTNEVFDSCANGGCRRFNCSQPTICIDPIKCKAGCSCKDGYSRLANGTCIPEDQCPVSCRKPHEIYDPCPPNCPPQTCDRIGKKYFCPRTPANCNGACRCEKGYYRNQNGECVTEEECRKCKISCGPNERYEEKPSSVCEPLDCSEVGFPLNCPPENTDCYDEPGCICDNGYVRNDSGDCVERSQCPSCGGDPNAVAGCGVNCGRTCSTYGKDVACIQICYINACDCKDGFVYDEIVKKCVRFKDCSKKPSGPSVNVTDAKIRLDKGSITLSGEFIYQLHQKRRDENFATSALSLILALGQIIPNAEDLVLKQLLSAFNLKSKDEVKKVFLEETSLYRNQDKVQFEVASKYYINKYYELSEDFIRNSDKYFQASGQNIDFSNSEKAVATINKWVANKTHNKIKDLLTPDAVDDSTLMVLVNAVYFLGNWIHQFNVDYTKKCDFTKLNKDVVQVDTMYQENTFKYADTKLNGIKIQALEMPYKNDNFTFLVILPELGGFDDAVSALRKADNFLRIHNSLKRERVQVYLPKMEVTTTLDMAELLQKVNVTAMFNPNNNGFKGILKEDQPLYISSAIQKVFVKCDEKGTEAAAATAIVASYASLPLNDPPILKADHPFLFYILLKKKIIFGGAFKG